MTLKDWFYSVSIVLVAIIALYGATHPNAIVDATKVDVNQIAQAVFAKVTEGQVGSASSPSVVNGCMEVNGVTRCSFGQRMKTATTTVCSMRIVATSTLTHASSNYQVASTSATRVFIAKGANSNATTTVFTSGVVAASGTGVLVASSTDAFGAGITPTAVLFPGDYVNFQAPDIKSAGDVGTGARAAGLCVLETIQY